MNYHLFATFFKLYIIPIYLLLGLAELSKQELCTILYIIENGTKHAVTYSRFKLILFDNNKFKFHCSSNNI